MDIKTILARTLLALAAMAALPALAQATPTQGADCNGGILYTVRSHGESQPVAAGGDPASLQQNRRVEVVSNCPDKAAPGRGQVVGQFTVDLPNGGVIWATEDPALVPPALDVQAASTAPFAEGRLARPLRFRGYSNYPSFIEKVEVTIYRGSDSDLVAPLATLAMPKGTVMDAEWDGMLPAGSNLQVGDDLLYITRAYGANGAFDETAPRRIQLVTPEDFERMVCGVIEAARTTGMFSGFCYTQFADTFQEVNGLLHADRTPKIDLEKIAAAVRGRDPRLP
jgi:hypothetical protein